MCPLFLLSQTKSVLHSRASLNYSDISITSYGPGPTEDQHYTAPTRFRTSSTRIRPESLILKEGDVSLTQKSKPSNLTLPRPLDAQNHWRNTSELRKPAVDPRKSRRYCTDFGFKRERAPAEEISSLTSAGSTPVTTQGSSDSEVSSLEEQSALDFPHPPSISPALRHMKSSPWFTEEETCAVKEFLRKRWADRLDECKSHQSVAIPEEDVQEELQKSPSSGLKHPTWATYYYGRDDTPKELDLELVGEVLVNIDMNAVKPDSLDNLPALEDLSLVLDSSESITRQSQTTSDLLRWSTSHRNTPQLPPSNAAFQPSDPPPRDVCGPHRVPVEKLPKRLPRIIRKVASMRYDTIKSDYSMTGHKPIPKMKSLKFMGVSESTSVPNRSGLKTSDHQRGWSFGRGTLDPSVHLSSSRHMSVPLSANRLGQASCTEKTTLQAPFKRQSARVDISSASNNDKMPKSFMDITPEQRPKSDSNNARKERVRKLLARASNGVAGWSKLLTRKVASQS